MNQNNLVKPLLRQAINPKVPIFYILRATGFTSESTVQHFRTKKEAEAVFEKMKIKDTHDATDGGQTLLSELKQKDFYSNGKRKSGTIWYWFSGDVMDGETDIYVELGRTVI